MSRRRRSRTSLPSLPPGLSTGNGAASTAPPEPEVRPEIVVRYAQSDQDVVAIHQFLLVVAGPTLPGPVDARKSAEEVWRIVHSNGPNLSVALMAIRNDLLIGTFGLICVPHWWSDLKFLVNRWAFCLPGSRAWKPLLREAKAIAVGSEMELHLIGENRGKVLILNKSRLRQEVCHLFRQPTGKDRQLDANGDAA